MKKLGLYIHIPFCIRKCGYCDFLSFSGIGRETENLYVDALIREMNYYMHLLRDYYADTLFFGGGTPSVLSLESMDKIMNAVYEKFKLGDEIEITMESNPGTLTGDKLKKYMDMGINRLSMGLQSFDDDELRLLGRIHSADDFLNNYYEARKAGFENINVDLMFGIPGQNIESWTKTLARLIKINPEHISFYSLEIEENTEFWDLRNEGRIMEASDYEDRKMYAYAVDLLKSEGYMQYEISNSARKGYECRHNLKYWSMDDYLGLGLGAHSFIEGERFGNETDLERYINNKGHEQRIFKYQNTFNDNVSEYMFTGLRKSEGISARDFEMRFRKSVYSIFNRELLKLQKEKLIDADGDRIRLTPKGIDISNYVLSEFILGS